MDLTSLSGSFAHISTDWVILAVMALLLTIDALRSGASRAIAISMALPMTYISASVLSKTALVGPSLSGLKGVPLSVFVLVLFAVFTLLAYRISRDHSSAAALKAVIAGVTTAVLLIVFWIQIPALSGIWEFSAPAAHLFGSAYALFWVIVSYALLAAVRS